MSETPSPGQEGPPAPGSGESSSGEGVGDALRAAVERTLSATAGSATETRQRAQELLDDVVRRGVSARERVSRRGEEATQRIAGALGDLRPSERGGDSPLLDRIEDLEARIAALERVIVGDPNPQVEGERTPGGRGGPTGSGG